MNDEFGTSVGLSADGGSLVVGAPGEDSAARGIGGDQESNAATNSGAVYVFRWSSSGNWAQEEYIKASNVDAADDFGESVSISADGTTLAVGAPGEDSAARGIGGEQESNAEERSGAVYVFRRDSVENWFQEAYIKKPRTLMAAVASALQWPSQPMERALRWGR